ncbi:pimeloyl-ACP methyl ester carboxylesterase [Tamaricihabitans halophyticus]|uniref:Pimeloyl-ACP methyl ester carboxylesterase n=1 Tax=Tamaricihabitans halophyticus TaxID=1262583 RepID=A0A4R2QZQ8_9PSEU|nr:alpha/beta fold hydrolase [Tamaricihabitans halophyticus]TCP55187.1 pimeloyl-ACP methyl ester carboxylesterase [Tamaricihabitans halophyticus]
MTTFVLVHARWHGAWCWERVVPSLRDAGHTVHTPDRASFNELLALLKQCAEPVVLVGHSSSGMVISKLAQLRPDLVHLLVYVSAFLLPNGTVPPEFAGQALTSRIVEDAETNTMTVRDPESVLFNRCGAEDASWAAERLVPEPAGPPSAAEAGPDVAQSNGRFGSVARAYVECLHDRALELAAQRMMHAMLPCLAVYQLEADHSPFLSTPQELANCLLAAVGLRDRLSKGIGIPG